MSDERTDALSASLAPVAASAGLLLEQVSVAPSGRRTLVRAVVDLPDGPGGVSSDALADVSREISRALDEADLFKGAYILEVSTPGLDRPLTQPRHFRRAEGRLVTVTTAEGTITGRLTEVGTDAIVVDGRAIPLADIRHAVQEPDFTRED